MAAERDDAHDPRGRAPGRGLHPRVHRGLRRGPARSSCATRPRTRRRSRAFRPTRFAPPRASTRRERHAAIFYTLGITEHACGVDNIWSLSNLVLMTGHLGYESTGLNALRGQNNVQGLNDSGANPMYLPGLPARGRPGDPAEVLRGLGSRGAGDDRVPARPDDERAPRRPRAGARTSSARTPRRPSRTPATSRRGSGSSTS